MPKFIKYPEQGTVTVIGTNQKLDYPMERYIDGQKFIFLGAGTYNIAYKSDTPPYLVYKEPFEENDSDLPERAVRLWNEINSSISPPARIQGDGWIAPFIAGTEPSENEICNAILDIYQRTGRIVVDALVYENFVKMENNQIVCVDIGAALKLEQDIEEEESEVSLDFWNGVKKKYDPLFSKYQNFPHYQCIVKMTKALLVLQHFRPDVRDLIDRSLVPKLARKYDSINSNNLSNDDDIYSIFPINLKYFAQLPLFQDISSDTRLTDENKKALCKLYQRKSFTLTHKQCLLQLLKNGESADTAIQAITGKNAADIGDLYQSLISNISASPTAKQQEVVAQNTDKQVEDALARKSDTVETQNDIPQLKSALQEYTKLISGIIGFFTTWQSTKTLGVFERLEKIANGELQNQSIHNILNDAKLDPSKSRLGRILQKHGFISAELILGQKTKI